MLYNIYSEMSLKNTFTKMKRFIAICCLLSAVFAACEKADNQGDADLYSFFDEAGQFGFMDKEGVVKIEPQWDVAYDFYMGYGIVCKDSKYGLIDQNGNLLIPLKYDNIGNFTTEVKSVFNLKFLAKAKLNGYWGFIDAQDNTVIPFNYRMLSNFSNGLAVFRTDVKYGYINESGEVILPAIYDGYGLFSEDLAWVGILTDGIIKWGVINKSGETVLPFMYDNKRGETDKVNMDKFVNGLSPYFIRNVESGFLNSNGELLYETIGSEYEWTGNFSEGLASVGKDGLVGYINVNGIEMISRQFYSAWDFNKGVAPFKYTSDGLWGYLLSDGSIMKAPQFLNASGFNNYIGWVMFPDSTSGMINLDGRIVWRSTTIFRLNEDHYNIPLSKGIVHEID